MIGQREGSVDVKEISRFSNFDGSASSKEIYEKKVCLVCVCTCTRFGRRENFQRNEENLDDDDMFVSRTERHRGRELVDKCKNLMKLIFSLCYQFVIKKKGSRQASERIAFSSFGLLMCVCESVYVCE